MDEPISKLELGALISTFFELARRHWTILLGTTLALAALDTALIYVAGDSASGMVSSIVSIAAVYLILRHVLRREDMVTDEGAFGSYFGVSFLSGIGMIVGLFLLVVPGLYLVGRWSLAPALVVARGLRAGEALSASWRLTAQSAWQLVLVYLIGLVVIVIAMVLTITPGELLTLGEGESLALLGTEQVVLDLTVVAGAVLTAAIFKQLVGSTRVLEDVFA